MDNTKYRIHFIVNGKDVDIEVDASEMLADVLRERLGLIGTKIGCNEAECGACTVIINGKPILSCTYPAVRANGKTILTIEGLAKETEEGICLHPLQEAFIKHGAVQCGFCIPGQIMTSYALLQENPSPSDEEIRYALKDTLCRCGSYPSIERAIHSAEEAMRTGKSVISPKVDDSIRAKNIIGHSHVRPEAMDKVTGKALYTDDLKFPGMLIGVTKRSGVPHGIITKLNVDAARKVPGVVVVLTAEDIPGQINHGLVIQDWPTLVGIGQKVRYVGDAIAIVAAETKEAAEEALDKIEVDYQLLPVITSAVQANEPGVEKIHESGNLLKHIKVRKGDIEKGFEESDVIIERTFHTGIVDHAFIEPECSIARVTEDGRIEVYVGSQIPYQDRSQIAAVMNMPEDRIRVKGMMIGGGFGGKEDIMGQIHAALLAWKTKRPVKILYDRHESLVVHPKRHATQITVKMGAKRDGTLVAVKTELYGDTGAYASLGEKVMTRATTHSTGPYTIPHVKADCFAMYTNNPPAGAFRGFGVLQSAFAIETTIDELAETLGIHPVEIRLKNALKVGSVTNTGQLLKDSVGLVECIDKTWAEMQRLGGDEPFKAKIDPQNPNLVRAWGLAVAFKNTGLGGGAPDKAGAEVELYPDGVVEVRTSSAELGQGLVTVLQLIAAEELGLKTKDVKVYLSDTDKTPDGGPTTASRQTYVTGNAVKGAATALRDAITSVLAEHFDIAPDKIKYIEGLAQVGEQNVTFGEIAHLMQHEGKSLIASYEYWAPKTMPLGEGGDMHFVYSYAAQAAEVEVNSITGEVKVLHVISANDVGTAINPLGLKGQVEGGVVMGLGNALTERFIVKDGYVITDRLAKYRIPSIAVTPEITSIIVEHPAGEGPFGAKGVGEVVSIPTTPAITNAIYNAVGIRVRSLPVDQELIASEINGFQIGG
ncbi:MAG: molybdopterin cofactor-binding domain-containing protein [Anaerolineaceae bacterium]